MPSDFPYFFEGSFQALTYPDTLTCPDDIMFKDQDLLENFSCTIVNYETGGNQCVPKDSFGKGSRQTKIPSPVGSSPDEHSHHSSSSDSCSDSTSQLVIDTESESLQSVTNLFDHWYADSQTASDDKPRKAQKTSVRDFPTSTPCITRTDILEDEQVFNADSAASSSYFAFKEFGKNNQPFGDSNDRLNGTGAVSSTSSPEQVSPALPRVSTHLTQLSRKNIKQPSLTNSYSAKINNYELRILAQPEEQHRARYMTEGSRGSVKDKNNDGYPTIKLFGYTQPVVLQVFVGNDSGRVRPHGFYQACKVSGKNATACKEKDIDGTTVIEINMLPENDMTVSCDCVGILKLRNADVERRMKFVRGKKKSVHARLVFRVTLSKPDGSPIILQCASTTILCTQPPGVPEICKKSLSSSSVVGGQELFIIGKNFAKGSKVIFQQLSESGNVIWEAFSDIDQEYFHQTHIVCKVPPYKSQLITNPATVSLIVHSAERNSDPHLYTYEPEIQVKTDVAIRTENENLPQDVNSGMDFKSSQLSRSGSFSNMISGSSSMVIPVTPIIQSNPFLPGNILSNHSTVITLDNSNTGMDTHLSSLSLSPSLPSSNNTLSLVSSPITQTPITSNNFAFPCLPPSLSQSEPMQGVESLAKSIALAPAVDLLEQSALSAPPNFNFDCLSSPSDLMVELTREDKTKPLMSPNSGFTFDLVENVNETSATKNLALPNNCSTSQSSNDQALSTLSANFNFQCPLKPEPHEEMDMCREALIAQQKVPLNNTSHEELVSTFSFNHPVQTSSEPTPMQGVQSLQSGNPDFQQQQSISNLDFNDILNYVNEVLSSNST